MRNENFIKKIFSSKIFFLLGLIILGSVVWVLSKKIVEGRKIDAEIKAAEEEIARLETKNGELNDFISYLNTEAFLEEEARLKFDLQKQGESVLIIPKESLSETAQKEGDMKNGKKVASGNLLKWWNYFFNKN
jgi:cell division protein FtsB